MTEPQPYTPEELDELVVGLHRRSLCTECDTQRRLVATVRAAWAERDELGEEVRTLDRIINQHEADLATAQAENERLREACEGALRNWPAYTYPICNQPDCDDWGCQGPGILRAALAPSGAGEDGR